MLCTQELNIKTTEREGERDREKEWLRETERERKSGFEKQREKKWLRETEREREKWREREIQGEKVREKMFGSVRYSLRIK